MHHAAHDLDVVEAMLADLPDLLEGDHLFREVVVERSDEHAGADKVTLTLSALLDALDTLAATSADEARLAAARAALAEQVEARRERYVATLQRELRSARNDWRAFAEDLADERDDLAGAWAYASQNRSRAERLLAEAAAHGLDDGGARTSITGLDRRIRPHVVDAAYHGPPGDQGRFPRETWWWLWSAPRD